VTRETRQEGPDDQRVRDRFRGCLIGLAVGDALGAAAEFLSEEQVQAQFGQLADYRGSYWHAGQYTDDTAMARCIAESLVQHRDVMLPDIAHRFVHWMLTDGAGIGKQTAAVLMQIHAGQEARAASDQVWEQSGHQAAGNGGVMRCAPIALLPWRNPEALVRDSCDTCYLTHADPRCQWSCVAANAAIAALLAGRGTANQEAGSAILGQCEELEQALATAARVPVSEMRVDGWNQGYTLVTTQIAFAALCEGKPFEAALIDVVNKGGDADTNGAVAGALLGARDGYEAIPARWREGLLARKELVALADELFEVAGAGR
jgi:ADP-ribosylglycohydrolase